MLIYDEEGNLLEDPDLNLGYIDKKVVPISHMYVIDKPEVSHKEVVHVYPETGGMDVVTVVDEPEEGHWESFDENGEPIHVDMNLDGFLRDKVVEDTLEVGIYIPYTLQEIEDRKVEMKAIEEHTKLMEETPRRLVTVEETQDDIILLLADIVGGTI